MVSKQEGQSDSSSRHTLTVTSVLDFSIARVSCVNMVRLNFSLDTNHKLYNRYQFTYFTIDTLMSNNLMGSLQMLRVHVAPVGPTSNSDESR